MACLEHRPIARRFEPLARPVARHGRRGAVLFGSVFALLMVASAAHADQIDGHWCFDDGRNMSIAGPQIVTPGGNRIEGNYTRHTFSYTVPKGEPGPGTVTTMQQLNDLMIQVHPEGTAEPQIWRRCTTPSV